MDESNQDNARKTWTDAYCNAYVNAYGTNDLRGSEQDGNSLQDCAIEAWHACLDSDDTELMTLEHATYAGDEAGAEACHEQEERNYAGEVAASLCMEQDGNVTREDIEAVIEEYEGTPASAELEKFLDDAGRNAEYFVRDCNIYEHLQELAEEDVRCLTHNHEELPFYIVIDWDATVENIKVDWSTIDLRGNTYWFRG